MMRTSTTSEYGAAWRKWLAGSVKHLDADMGLQLLSASEQKALSERLDQSGGFVVPADVGVGIFARIVASGRSFAATPRCGPPPRTCTRRSGSWSTRRQARSTARTGLHRGLVRCPAAARRG